MSKKTRSSQAREARKRAAAAENRSQALQPTYDAVPDHVKLIDVAGTDWERLVEADASYKQARGIVSQLIKEQPNKLQYDTFIGLTDDEIVAKIMGIITDPKMLPIEERFAKKFGAFWQPAFSSWSSKVFDLYKYTTWGPDEAILKKAVNNVIMRFKTACIKKHKTGRLTPIELDQAFSLVPKGKNSGYPFYTSKWSRPENQQMADYYLNEAKQLLEGGEGLLGRPFILFKRIQVNGNTPKMRPIQGAPKEDAIASKVFTEPFVHLLKSMEQFVGFNGGERVGSYVKDKMMGFPYLLSADFSAFDANAQMLVPYAFEVIKAMFPATSHAYLDNTMRAYQNVKLITPIGIIYSDKINGVASGCGWTSILGTVANAICTEYTMLRMEAATGKRYTESMVLSFGDDIAIASHNEIDLTLFSQCMAEVGMECNESKQEQSCDYFSFLGYFHFRNDPNYLGKFPIMRLAPGLKYKERNARISEIISEIEGNGDSEDEIEEIKAKITTDHLNAMAIASKLNVARGHDDFDELCQLIKENAEFLIPDNVLPLMKYRKVLRTNRTSREAEFPVITALFGEVMGDPRITNREWAKAHTEAQENGWAFCSLSNKPEDGEVVGSQGATTTNPSKDLGPKLGSNPLLELINGR